MKKARNYHGMEDDINIAKAIKYCDKFIEEEGKYRNVLEETPSNYSMSSTEISDNYSLCDQSFDIKVCTEIAMNMSNLEYAYQALKSIHFKAQKEDWRNNRIQAIFLYAGIKYYNTRDIPYMHKKIGDEIKDMFNKTNSNIYKQMALIINNFIKNYEKHIDDIDYIDTLINPALLLAFRYRDDTNKYLYQSDIVRNKLPDDLKEIANKLMSNK